MTNEEYHGRSEISKSDLDLLSKSPFHFKNKHLFRQNTPALILGSAVHTLTLEPELFDREYLVADIDRRTKDGKATEAKAKMEGKNILSTKEFNEIKEMADSVHRIKASSVFLNKGKAEQSFFGEIDGVKVKCRPDYYNEELGLVVDLKTTVDASPKGFQKSIGSFNYHIQSAFYKDVMESCGKKVNNFLFIAVEKKAPYMVGFYDLDNVSIDFGREKYKELLDLYKYCTSKNEWWGYANFDKDSKKIDVVQTLTLPAWKFYE